MEYARHSFSFWLAAQASALTIGRGYWPELGTGTGSCLNIKMTNSTTYPAAAAASPAIA